ncbi:MAG: SRPBCC family protein [Chloroflexia bacterium]
MRVEKELVVNAPVDRVYELWTDFERFPRFMEHVESVTKTGEDAYHWKAKMGPRTVEWDSKVVGRVPNRTVTWRSTSGAENAGAVTLADQGTITLMQVVIEYHPSWFEGLLDTVTREMSRSLEDDLERFKSLAENDTDRATASVLASERTAASSGNVKGATSENMGAGNTGASGPSGARAGLATSGATDAGANAVPSQDAAPISRSGAMAGGHEGGGGYATGGTTVGSMGGSSRSGSMGADAPEPVSSASDVEGNAPEPVSSASDVEGNPDESLPTEQGMEREDLSARSGEYNAGHGVPPPDSTSGTETPVAVSGSHHDPDAADQPATGAPGSGVSSATPTPGTTPGVDTTGEDTSGITGPSLYTDEAAGYRDYSDTAEAAEATTGEQAAAPAGPIEEEQGTMAAGEQVTAPASPIEEEQGTTPGMVGGTGGWGSSTGGSVPSGGIGPGSVAPTSASGGFDSGPARDISPNSDIGRGSNTGETF